MRTRFASHTAGRDGYALAVVLILMFAMGIVGLAFLSLAGGETKMSQSDLQSQRAFWLAEAGKERALGWLAVQSYPPSLDLRIYQNIAGPDGGSYTVDCLVDTTAAWQTTKPFVLDSVGSSGNRQRRIRERIRMISFAQYGYFTESEVMPNGDDIWFITGDVLEGLIHSNGTFKISGNPQFLSRVTSHSSYMTGYQNYTVTGPGGWPVGGNNPYFAQGFQLNAPIIPLPTTTANLKTEAQNGGLYLSNASDIELGRNLVGAQDFSRFRYKNTTGAVWSDRLIASLGKKIVYCNEDVQISGVLDGELTISSRRNIWIINDVTYRDSNAGTPLPGCNDLLGLVAEKNIVYKDNVENRSNLTVDAVMMALDTSIYGENYDALPLRGVLKVWGGLIQKYRGAVGTFRNGAIYTGYLKDYHYDPRVTARTPPYFPLSGTYEELAWSETWDNSYPF